MTDAISSRNPEMQKQSLLAWVVGRRLTTPKGGPIRWQDSPWLVDIYNDKSRVMAIRKSSQARISTYAVFRTLHFCLNNTITVIFTEPTRDDAQKFSSSRVQPLLNYNPWLLDYVAGGTELLKIAQEIGGVKGSHIHFRGTTGEKEAFTIDADEVIVDEKDTSNQEVIATFDTRLIASPFKRKLEISTPSIPNYGIDAAYQMSDQMTWLWKCSGCNAEISPGDEYFNIIDREQMCFRCPKCGRRLNRGGDEDYKGQWVAKYPDRPVRGYWISQPMCLYIPVADIVKAEQEQKTHKFKNFWLGVPAEAGVATVTRELILQKCFLSGHAKSTEAVGRRRVMGVDQGNWLFYEVGEVAADQRSYIVDMGHTRDWNDLYTLMNRHEIEVCVLDALPEIRLARRFARAFPGRVYFCEYSNIQEPVRWKGKERYQILLNRTQVLDAVAEDIAAGAVQLYSPMDEEIDEECVGGRVGGWIQHWMNQHRVPPEEPDEPVRYMETGPDHRTHTNAYRKVAESKLRNRPVNEVWVATAGPRTFAPASIEREVVTEEEAREMQEKVVLRGKPILNLRSGGRRR